MPAIGIAPHRRRRGDVTLDDRLDQIEDKLDKLMDTHVRLRALEIIVYGACGMALTSLVGAVLYLVIRQPGHG